MAAQLKLGILAKAISEPLGPDLADVSSLVADAAESMRSLSFQICPPVLYDLGLLAAVQWLADDLKDTFHLGVTVRSADETIEMEQAMRVVAFRAIRELLINVAKHAQTNEATVTLKVAGDDLQVTVCDHGVGCDATRAKETSDGCGLGLFGIREQMRYLGGDVTIDTQPGQGMSVHLIIPRASTMEKEA